jgi:hypothetical protein
MTTMAMFGMVRSGTLITTVINIQRVRNLFAMANSFRLGIQPYQKVRTATIAIL